MDTTTGRLTLSRGESRTAHLTVRTRTQSGVMRHLPGIVAAALLVGGGIAQAAPVVPVHGVYETEAGAEHTLYAVVREDEEATRWMADGRHVVHVLDSSTESFDRLPAGEMEGRRVVPTVGDGAVQRDLIKAQIQDAAVFIALTNEDSRNALAAQIAKRIFNVPVVICRIEDPTKQQMYLSLDITAISASSLVTDMILEAANNGAP